MLGAILSFTTMAIAGRQLGTALDTFEIMTYRSALGIVFILSIVAMTRRWGDIRARRLGLHLVRNVFHFTGQNLWFLALTMIPLAQLFALEFSSPIWVTLAAPLLLGERLGWARVFALALGFCGILIVAQPDLNAIDPGVVAAALAAIGFAGSAVFTKVLTRTETITSILFFLVLTQAIMGFVLAVYDGNITWPTATHWPLVALIAVAGLAAHFSLTKALSLAPASVVVPIDFLRLPVIAIVGSVFYGEALEKPVLIGAALIFVAIYINLLAAQTKPTGLK